jgi:hypothetical protein
MAAWIRVAGLIVKMMKMMMMMASSNKKKLTILYLYFLDPYISQGAGTNTCEHPATWAHKLNVDVGAE